MNREQKAAAVEGLNKIFAETPHIVVTGFRGLTVNQANLLRRQVRGAGGSYSVVRTRLARRAALGTPAEELVGRFDGPCAIATHESDPVVLAKALAAFAKENPQLELMAGLVDQKDLLDADGLKYLSSLPGLPETRQQLVTLILTSATQLVRLLGTPGSQIARAIDARREQQESAP